MAAIYQVWLLQPTTGEALTVVDSYDLLQYVMRVNHEGTFRLQVPGSFNQDLAQVDTRVVIWRKPRGGVNTLEFAGFVRYVDRGYQRGKDTLTLAGFGYSELLMRRIIAYNAGSTQAEKSGAADDVMKAFVRENLGASATDAARNLTSAGVSVQSDLGDGTNIEKSASRRNLLTVLQEIAYASRSTPSTAVFFGAIPLNSGFDIAFRTKAGQWGRDHRYPDGADGPVIFALERGNIENPTLIVDRRNEATFVYGAGQGTEDNRQIVTVSDSDRISESPLNRRELLFDGRSYTDTAALTSAARLRLEDGRPRYGFLFDVLDTPGTRYGVHWGLGDQATVVFKGEQHDLHIAAVEVLINKNGEKISPRLENL